MTEIALKEEHKEHIHFLVNKIQENVDHIAATQTHYENAKKMSTCLYEAQRTMIKLNLGTSDASSMRNAEILSHFISEARHGDERLAFYRDAVTALREALSLFVADNYEINIAKEWQLNVDRGTLIYGESL